MTGVEPPDDDVAREIALLVVGLLPLPDASAAAQMVETAIRQRFGAREVYIRAATRPAERVAAVGRDLAAGVPLPAIRARHGISRATLYRYLRRPARGE